MSPRTIIVALFPVDGARDRGDTLADLVDAAIAGTAAALLALRLWAYRAIDRAILCAPSVERWLHRATLLLGASLIVITAARMAAAWWRAGAAR